MSGGGGRDDRVELAWSASHGIGMDIQNSEQTKRNNGDDEEDDIHYGLAYINKGKGKDREYFGWELWHGVARD